MNVYSRRSFLGAVIKIVALGSFGFVDSACQRKEIPPLRGISSQEYLNMEALAKVFLKNNPIKNFDIGKALDNYVYGHPSPLQSRDKIHELASLPSSLLASLFLDLSFTPLVKLNIEQREKRLLAWRDSPLELKRGLYRVLHTTCFFLLGSSHDFLHYTGYLRD